MSYSSVRVFNHFFVEIQTKMKKGNAFGVLDDLTHVSNMVFTHSVNPIEYYYLTNGVDPNKWLSEERGYKRYKKEFDAPIFWLRKYSDKESGRLLSDLALERMDIVEEAVRIEIDRMNEAKELERKLRNKAVDEERETRNVKGTPFDLSWVIKPPSKER